MGADTGADFGLSLSSGLGLWSLVFLCLSEEGWGLKERYVVTKEGGWSMRLVS